MTKQTEALKMAIEALESFEIVYGDTDLLMPHNFYKSLQACKEALEQPTLTYEDGFAHGYEAHRAEQALEQSEQEVKCNPHPDAPHGFMRDESHSQDRYVCECEYWKEPSVAELNDEYLRDTHVEGLQPAQEPVAWLSTDSKANEIVKSHPAPAWQGNKEFVGLSYDEITQLKDDWGIDIDHWNDFARAIEQALKEKNNAV